MDGSKIKNMEEFAALSGLSRPTVSKYFNDPKSVRASTRTRIESAREKYDYHPNIFAMKLSLRAMLRRTASRLAFDQIFSVHMATQSLSVKFWRAFGLTSLLAF